MSDKETKFWEVIAEYPECRRHNIKKGQILTDNNKTAIRDQDGQAVVAIKFWEFPHIFKDVTNEHLNQHQIMPQQRQEKCKQQINNRYGR